jgi:predicted RNase H-like nuclease (RuvC/YqgF family)
MNISNVKIYNRDYYPEMIEKLQDEIKQLKLYIDRQETSHEELVLEIRKLRRKVYEYQSS